MVRRRVVVRGSVQGVGFRVSVERRAGSLGVAGWVRNNRDGSLEAVFEGERGTVDELVRWCESGPRGADVERVEVFDERPEGLEEFSVR